MFGPVLKQFYIYTMDSKGRGMNKADVRILVIDDMQSVRSTIKMILGGLGFKWIDEASDVPSAINQIKDAVQNKASYNLIFTDLVMNELLGTDVIKFCSEDARLKNIPFIVVTSEKDMDLLKPIIDMKVAGIILKPLTINEVQKKLEKIIMPLIASKRITF